MSQSDKFWDGVAEKYARKAVPDEAAYQRKLAETQSFLTTDMQVLEFGCGTGSTAIHHAPYVKHIDALDISEKMLEIGRQKAHKAGAENITFSRGTLDEFNAGTASQDAVLGLNVIHLIPDRQETFAEIARILKPGGVFVSATGCLGHSWLRFLTLVVPLGKLFRLMPDLFVITEEQLLREIADAGFSIETCWHHGTQGIEVFIIARKHEK